MHLLFVTDESYLQHLWVTLASLFSNTSRRYSINIIDGGIDEGKKEKLSSFAEDQGSTIRYLKFDTRLFQGYKISLHVTEAVYYRILAPNLLNELDKVLYLDCDLLVNRDLAPLYELAIERYLVAAVENADPEFDNKRRNKLGMPPNSPYFNSGVMLMNLKKMRNTKFSSKVLDFLQNNTKKIKYWDQDGLNVIAAKNWLPLHPKWNLQTNMIFNSYRMFTYDEREMNDAIQDPFIIHYTNSSKPWDYMNDHPYKSEYWKYLAKTPFSSYSPLDYNLVNMVKKNVSKLKKRVLLK